MKQRRFPSLFSRQLLLTCLLAFVLGAAASSFQFFGQTRRLHDQFDRNLRQLLATGASPLGHKLQAAPPEELRPYLEKLSSLPTILSVQLIDPAANTLLSLGGKQAGALPGWKQFLYGPNPPCDIELQAPDGSQSGWILRLGIDHSATSAQLGKNLFGLLATNLSICLFLSLALSRLHHRFGTRHITELTRQLKNFREEGDKGFKLAIPDLPRDDEIGLLAEAINTLCLSRQQLQNHLAEHNQFVTTVTAISPVGLFRVDNNGELIWYNQKARVMLGILDIEKSLDEWLGNLHADHRNRVIQLWRESIERQLPFRAEFPLGLVDNKIRWVICEAIPSWAGGKYEGFVGTLTDVTPLKQATDKLHESEERYHAITQTANSAIILTEANGRIRYWNPAAERIFGYPPGEALGENLASLIIPPESRELFIDACPEFEGESSDFSPHPIELEAAAKGGKKIPVEMSMSTFKIEESWHVALIISDISKRILSEKEKVNLLDQLRQSQKMEAMGTLAGGIAHDFNNILTPILGFGQLLQMQFTPGTKERDRAEKILASANRAKDLVGQILSFSRKSKEETQPIQVVHVVKESLKLLRAGIPTTINIKTRIPNRDFWVVADQTRIHQILMNLATNAVQAMNQNGGTLTIEMDQIQPEPENYPQLRQGSYLRLSVKDTGDGIDPYTLARIFDPYFTTKEADAGTGLGLTVVQGSVSSMGGCVEVESEVGAGSTFRILLPLISGGDFQREIKHQETIPHGGGQRILLVDDEMSLVNIGREFLEDLGYQVTGMTNSLAAMEILEKDPYSFDMLITDQTMPQLTGLELSRQAKKLRPDMPIVLCTGQRGLLDDDELEQIDILRVLGKPDLFNELAETLRDTFGPLPAKAGDEPEDLNIWS